MFGSKNISQGETTTNELKEKYRNNAIMFARIPGWNKSKAWDDLAEYYQLQEKP